MDDKELVGRTALVTGGSRGIGRAICQKLSECGARVAINYVTNQSAAEEVCQFIGEANGSAAIYRADVSDLEQTSGMFDKIEEGGQHPDLPRMKEIRAQLRHRIDSPVPVVGD